MTGTVAHAVFEFKGFRYGIDYDFRKAYSIAPAIFMFEEGRYSTAGNRVHLIRYVHPGFPEAAGRVWDGDESKLIEISAKEEN